MTDAPMPNPKSLIESTAGWTLMQLNEVVASRRDQPSYHVFSEENARGQIFNLGKGEQLRSTKCDGNVLLIPIEGRIKVILNGEERAMAVGSQLLINPGVVFSVSAVEFSCVQVVWTPPFSNVEVLGQANEA